MGAGLAYCESIQTIALKALTEKDTIDILLLTTMMGIVAKDLGDEGLIWRFEVSNLRGQEAIRRYDDMGGVKYFEDALRQLPAVRKHFAQRDGDSFAPDFYELEKKIRGYIAKFSE